MYSFRGYNNPGRAIKPSFERPAKVEVPQTRSISIGAIGLRRGARLVVEEIKPDPKPEPKPEVVVPVKTTRAKKPKPVVYKAPVVRISKMKRKLNGRDIKIKLMREKELSYTQIAAALGLTRNQVAGICARCGF